ncbi:asparaginase [Actinomycetospora endophytica]|uniref:asparaginase n=1 Tax=Actinomycetospora endophytica TaxID=2291215 RepID=A0ABS8P7L0_9PSEU|nr:asparaginase [Actinomycetospora endophytica]MCD2194228.1 asparaginase [Actinomycetospora endophytica]
MTRLALLATGGTIATRATSEGRAVAATARDLLGTVTTGPDVDVVPIDAAGRLSFAATLDDVAALARTVRETCAAYDGVVVTHGTDTLEETAALLALTHDGATPVTITGAQRPFDDAAPDGPTNLGAALRWAAYGRPGVTVTFAGQVLPAIGVRKIHTSALSAFAAPDRGPLASADGGGSIDGAIREHAVAPDASLGDPPATLPRVDVVAQYVGADAHALDAAVAAGARGIVVAAFGAGNATPAVVESARRLLEQHVPVVVASRTGAGAVEGLYAGGGADLARAGALFAGDLSPWQARLLLAVALATAPDDPAGAARAWAARTGVA